MSDEAAQPEIRTAKRRPWLAYMTFVGVGMMLGGGVDISGPGGGALVVGFLMALVGLIGLAFSYDASHQ